mmetsp:Transcript_16827/g.41692  ORF Transcript_16827/g.41692 Transcript_16827/m.41692 type:complete len:203 (-) Transcript_16827:262-870(-)
MNMSISPPKRPAADHGLHSQQVFERKGRAYPVGPSWSPECDGSNLCVSFERPCYRVGPSTGASPAGSSTTSSWRASPCSGRSALSPGTSASTLRSLETSRFTSPRSPGTTTRTPRSDVETPMITGPPWRALPAELCALKPPPAAKGWEVRMPPAPSASPAPQPTYVSPPIIYAQPRPWKPEQGAGGSNGTPGFTFNVYRGCQ